MRAPEVCYGFVTLNDVQGALVAIVTREIVSSASQTNVGVDIYTVPSDRVFILSAANVSSVPGAGQVCSHLGLSILEEASQTIEIAGGPDPENTTADIDRHLNFSGEVWCAPGTIVRGNGVFNSGVAANTVGVRINGILIPRGNIQQA